MQRHTTSIILFLLFSFLSLQSCEEAPSAQTSVDVHEDATIGKTIDENILLHANNNYYIEYLQPDSFVAAYSYLNTIIQTIINTDHQISVAGAEANNICPIQLRIIDQAYTSTAFIIPGGFIYIYKDLLNALQSEAQLTAVLSHLILSSRNRISIPKLKERFTNNFIIDLADGGNLDVDINLVIHELKEVAYDSSLVSIADVETENTVCELGYDIQSYSDMFNHEASKNLQWFHLFPRNHNQYASYLFSTVNNYPQCLDQEIDGELEYHHFKQTLN
jgi:predicted Zn-dependent protease